jgi:hypothetical protein
MPVLRDPHLISPFGILRARLDFDLSHVDLSAQLAKKLTCYTARDQLRSSACSEQDAETRSRYTRQGCALRSTGMSQGA